MRKWRYALDRIAALEARVTELERPKPMVLRTEEGIVLWSGRMSYEAEGDET